MWPAESIILSMRPAMLWRILTPVIKQYASSFESISCSILERSEGKQACMLALDRIHHNFF